jgi:glycosyltransferase involved in cell wall biosynthesis
LRILYYTHPALFEPALCLAQELSRRVELHLVLEVSPGSWRTASFDLPERRLPAGLVPGDAVLRDAFPAGVRKYWQSAASFHLAVHPQRRSLHPQSWQISRRVLAYARDLSVDALHVDDVDVSPRLALALATSQHSPLVITVHDPEPHSGEGNWRKRLARRLAYPRAKRFVLYNEALKNGFARRFGIASNTIRTARLGAYDVCTEWSTADAVPPRSTVLFFGRLSAYKGLDIFYDAARIIAARVRGVTFVVAGHAVAGYTPPAPPDVPRSDIEVHDKYFSNEETAALFQNATVVVCPYRDATQSGVVLTAFAFGVPVVASDSGGLPEYVWSDRTGLVVPVGDAQATADAVIRILLEPGYREKLSANILAARNGPLSWRHTADAIVRAYQSLQESPSQ